MQGPGLFSANAAMKGSEESNEELYRRTVKRWRSTGSWQPWDEYAAELLARWRSDDPHRNRLGIVGGFEEGILAIEQATVARGEGTNVQVGQQTIFFNFPLENLNPAEPLNRLDMSCAALWPHGLSHT